MVHLGDVFGRNATHMSCDDSIRAAPENPDGARTSSYALIAQREARADGGIIA